MVVKGTPSTGKQILDLGCGNRKKAGAIGIDVNPASDADVIHDLNIFPYPFEDSSFDEIYADNVLEHLNDVIKVMEEIHRIGKNECKVVIDVPYFRARWAFIDPTHKHYFTVESFSYFDPQHIHHQLYRYSPARFTNHRIVFNEKISTNPIMFPIKFLANRYPRRYEYYVSHLLPLDCLTFYMRVEK